MMTTLNSLARTYNPGFLSDEELIGSFVVRHEIFTTLTAELAAHPTHILLEGPRGIGKTTLLLRVAAELRRDPKLRRKFVPLVLSEEVYEAGTVAEFFLECVFHFAQSTGDATMAASYDRLKLEPSEGALLHGVMSVLREAIMPGQRLVIFAENLHMLLAEQLGATEASKLNRVLSKEEFLILFATTVSELDGEHERSRLLRSFRHFHLDPLSDDDCRTLINARANRLLEGDKVRPIQILTGGNPRLITILSGFAATKSLRELMDELSSLIDEHTAYFKTNIESLPFRERKVLVGLADLWAPSTAAEVGRSARMDINTTSAYLARLERRGVVAVVDRGRTKTYQVAERLYNIYHLMRRSGRPSSRIRAVVDFMVSFYADEQAELVNATTSIASEACRVAPAEREAHFAAYETLVNRVTAPGARAQILASTAPEFFTLPDLPRRLRQSLPELAAVKRVATQPHATRAHTRELNAIDRLISEGKHALAAEQLRALVAASPNDTLLVTRLALLLHENLREYDEAIALYQSLIRQVNNPTLSCLLADALATRGRYDKAVAVLQASLEQHPEDGANWALLGHVLHFHLDRSAEARRAYKKAVKYKGSDPILLREYAKMLSDMNLRNEAENVLESALQTQPEHATWLQLARLHAENEELEAAELAFREAMACTHDASVSVTAFAHFLNAHNRAAEAVSLIRAALERLPGEPRLWHALGHAFESRSDSPAALAAFRRAIELDSADSGAWMHIGQLLAAGRDNESADGAFQNAVRADPNRDLPLLAYIRHLRTTNKRKLFHALTGLVNDVLLGERAWVSLLWSTMSEYPLNARLLKAWSEQMIHGADAQSLSGFAFFTAAAALAVSDEWPAALEIAHRFIEDAATKRAQADVIDFLIAATASGYARDVQRALTAGGAIQKYEPLAIAIDREIGAMPAAPEEISKIADDVVKQIRIATKKGGSKYLRQRLTARYRR